MTQLPALQAWGLIAVILALTVFADRASGPEAWFGPIYLLVICLAAWARGRRAGLVVAIACLTCSTAVNGADLYPFGGAAAAWNLSMRLLAVLIIIGLIGSIKRSYAREWLLARSDPLTGLLNRPAFFERAGAARRKRPWGMLAYVDLDGLKQTNDLHGHLAGDEVLRGFAQAVSGIIRGTDLFARIGGDEFLIFISTADEAEGQRMAELLHARMNKIPARAGLPVRCSMGALLVGPDEGELDDRHVQQADRLMYAAKRRGAGLRTATASQSARLAA